MWMLLTQCCIIKILRDTEDHNADYYQFQLQSYVKHLYMKVRSKPLYAYKRSLVRDQNTTKILRSNLSSNSETSACKRNERKERGGKEEVGGRYSYSKSINYNIYKYEGT